MHSYWEKAHKKIVEATTDRGVAEFARKVGVNRKSVEAWRDGAYPGVDILGDIARALDTEPWELLKPETGDPLLDRLLSVWSGLDDIERGTLLRMVEGYAATKPLDETPNAPTKPKKPGA